jgi:16S rRNA G966 N2-methylase RsmD
VTTGWRPTCSCNADTVPAAVCDLFAGSGTVGLVAQKLGRRAVLIDASADYLALARKRIEAVSLPMELNI